MSGALVVELLAEVGRRVGGDRLEAAHSAAALATKAASAGLVVDQQQPRPRHRFRCLRRWHLGARLHACPKHRVKRMKRLINRIGGKPPCLERFLAREWENVRLTDPPQTGAVARAGRRRVRIRRPFRCRPRCRGRANGAATTACPSTLCIVKIVDRAGEQLIRVRNMSAGGLMAEVGRHGRGRRRGRGRIRRAEDPVDGGLDPRRHGRASSSTRISTLANCSPAASRATVSARARRGSRSIARPACGSARPITLATCTTFRWAG